MTAHELQDLLRDVFEELMLARGDEERNCSVADLADRMEGVRRIRTYAVEGDGGGQLQVTIVAR